MEVKLYILMHAVNNARFSAVRSLKLFWDYKYYNNVKPQFLKGESGKLPCVNTHLHVSEVTSSVFVFSPTFRW